MTTHLPSDRDVLRAERDKALRDLDTYVRKYQQLSAGLADVLRVIDAMTEDVPGEVAAALNVTLLGIRHTVAGLVEGERTPPGMVALVDDVGPEEGS